MSKRGTLRLIKPVTCYETLPMMSNMNSILSTLSMFLSSEFVKADAAPTDHSRAISPLPPYLGNNTHQTWHSLYRYLQLTEK